MKKKLSLVLVFVMLVMAFAICAIPTVYAYDSYEGMWTTMGSASQHDTDFDGDYKSVAGYQYTERGFETVAADWFTSTPFVTIQSKNKVNLKQGVYMEVVVDEFSYETDDKWFNLHIWDSANIEPGSTEYGEGIQTLIRPGAAPSEKDGNLNATYSSITWYKEAFTYAATTSIDAANRMAVKDGDVCKHKLVLEISWVDNAYVVKINNTDAPAAVLEYMNTKFADGEAYIGFTMQTNKKGGVAGATITKFGTSRNTATVPYGEDYAESVNYDNSTAPIADPSTVPAGQPAVFMTGDKATSDLKNTPKTSTGANITVTDEGTIHVMANNSTSDFGTLRVKNDKSYDVADFPVVMCMTKNLCTCKIGAHEDCIALESMGAYVLVGDDIAPSPKNKIGEMDMCYDPIIIGEDNYLYFWVDFSEYDKEGRFNGVRFDIVGCDLITEGFNEFEMLWTGLFRDVDEAEAFALAYAEAIENDEFPDIGGGDDEEDTSVEDTTAKLEDTTAPTPGPIVPAGFPAVYMTGNKEISDLKNNLSSSTGAQIEITDNDTVKVTANGIVADFGTWMVDDEKSYDIANYPVIMCMTKNLCTCKMGTHKDCLALESMSAYVLVGDDIAPGPKNKIGEMDMCYDPIIIGEDNYLYFWVDLSDYVEKGRFNGVRFDIVGCDLITEGFNEFEMLWTGLFRDVDEAEAFASAYVEALENGEILTPPGYEETTTEEPEYSETWEPEYSETWEPEYSETWEPEYSETEFPEDTEIDTMTEEVTSEVEVTSEIENERVMNEGSIECDKYTAVNVNSTYSGKMFTFVPEMSGTYMFKSVGRYKTVGYVIDENGNTVAENFDGSGNFNLEISMNAGDTYYLIAEMYDSEQFGTFNVYLTCMEEEDETSADISVETSTEIVTEILTGTVIGTETEEDFTSNESIAPSVTEASTESETEKRHNKNNKDDDDDEPYISLDGCLGSVGFGGAVIAVTSVFGAALAFKRKKD